MHILVGSVQCVVCIPFYIKQNLKIKGALIKNQILKFYKLYSVEGRNMQNSQIRVKIILIGA